MSDEAANRKLQAAGPDRVVVRLELACRQDQDSWTLLITARIGAAGFFYEFPLGELEPARNSDMAGVLHAPF